MSAHKFVQYSVSSGYISIVGDEHNLPAFWAHPALNNKFPGVILLHEWWGLTAQIRAQARRLAEVGFYVVVPDLFKGQTTDRLDEAQELQARYFPEAVSHVNAALHVLKTHNHLTGKIAIIGWQMGGELALQMALDRPDIQAAVLFYAHPDHYLERIAADDTPILAFYGDNDPLTTTESIDKLRKALDRSPSNSEVMVYPNATIGFFNESLNTYDATHAAHAWEKMIDFLALHLELPSDKHRHKNNV